MEPDVLPEDEFEGEGEVDKDNPEYEFNLLERNFNNTLSEIEAVPEASEFGNEFTKLFEKLYDYFSKWRSAEKRAEELYDTKVELLEEIDVKKIIIDEDKSTIADQKGKIDYAQRLADNAHAREQTAQEVIDNLRRQLEQMNAEIELRNRMAQGEDEEANASANKKQQGLEREKERLMGEVQQLSMKLKNATEYSRELEDQNTENENKIDELTETLNEREGELGRTKRQKDKLEKDIYHLNLVINDKDVSIEEFKEAIEQHLLRITKMENQMRADTIKREKLLQEYEETYETLMKSKEDTKLCRQTLQKTQDILTEHNKLMKTREKELSHMKSELAVTVKAKDKAVKRMFKLEAEKMDMLEDKRQLKERVSLLELELHEYKKKSLQDQKEMDEINKDRQVLSKKLIKCDKNTKEQKKLIQMQNQTRKKLEAELDRYAAENRAKAQTIQGLHHERDKLFEEIKTLNKTIEEGLEEIKVKKNEIYDLKKTITKGKNELKNLQNLFDVIRTERNHFEKKLQECSALSGNYKNKLEITVHQVEQLKEDIGTREQTIIQADTIYRKVVKEKEMLIMEVNKANERIRMLKNQILEMDMEEKSLHKAIMQNDRKIREQGKDIMGLMNERDILGSQLVRRNDEIALLQQKLHIFETTLYQGNAQYDQRLDDIRLLKLEVKRLRQEQNLANKKLDNNVDLKKEVLLLERDLTAMRLRCRALEEELLNPMNVHRWRKLEGSDPEALELLQKLRLCQKRLLKQSAEALERERKLKETEQLYLNLKQVLSKQPSPETQQELVKTRRALKERGDHLKCLVSELNMAERQAKDFESNFERCTKELRELKMKYINLKKAHRAHMNTCLMKELSKATNPNAAGKNKICSCGEPKFAGGGFRMCCNN